MRLGLEWKKLYSKTKVFTSGLVNNKRLGYFVYKIFFLYNKLNKYISYLNLIFFIYYFL